MARQVFYSFHYKEDSQRVAKVRNIGVIEGNKPASDNDWEEVVGKGDTAIEKWINNQLAYRSCTIVLIGAKTAGRKWIKYEIKKTWDEGKGILGINIHNLTNLQGEQTTKGSNPFDAYKIGDTPMSDIVQVYDPPFSTSKYVYGHIADNVESWIEKAIEIRNKY
ncbi:MAG: TIR domain-containing protein [bacterium]|nr:TIR domain-containing protein [bacterium]